jgi:hypothetical protein
MTVRPPAAAQLEIFEALKSLGHQVTLNDRTKIAPLELDILVDGWLAIEVNGIYWHSYDEPETPTEKRRHYMKRERCRQSNIELISITDIEWQNKSQQLLSLIKARLGHTKKIGARKCTLVQVSSKQARDFCEAYHLQGFAPATHYLGLMYNDELMMFLSAGASRFSKKAALEIIRICTKDGYSVIGGLGKLLKGLPDVDLISYCDLDKFSGKTYLANQFVLEKISLSYYYWHKVQGMVSRNAMQKHRLSKLLDSYDPSLTEAQNAFNHGYHRYWTSGTATFLRKSQGEIQSSYPCYHGGNDHQSPVQ